MVPSGDAVAVVVSLATAVTAAQLCQVLLLISVRYALAGGSTSMLLRCLLEGVPVALLLKYKEDSCCVALCSPGARRSPALIHSARVPLSPRSRPKSRHAAPALEHSDPAEGSSGSNRSCGVSRQALTCAQSSSGIFQQSINKCSAGAAACNEAAPATTAADGSGKPAMPEPRPTEADVLQALFDRLPCMPPQLANLPATPAASSQQSSVRQQDSLKATRHTSVKQGNSAGGDGEISDRTATAACEAVAMLAAVLQHLRKASPSAGLSGGAKQGESTRAVQDPHSAGVHQLTPLCSRY